jgi:translocation and assembly module TamA
LSYEWEDYTVGSDVGTSHLLIAGLSYRWRRANDDIAPTHGQRVDVGFRGAGGEVISSEGFASLTASAKIVRSTRNGLRFIARVDGGVTWTNAFRELPPTVRFFAGGDNSVRGYPYQSLGPFDDTGAVIGGRFLLTTSAELQMPLKGKFGLAIFYDAGNAFAHTGQGIMEQGIGPGLRWQSPVGPIRADIAHAIHNDSWRFHFTMGPDL